VEGRRRFFILAWLCIAAVIPATAQEARWTQLTNTTVQLYSAGKYAEALPAAQEALRVAEATFRPSDKRLAGSQMKVGQVLFKLNRLAEARDALTRSLASYERAVGPNSPEVATCAGHLALVYEAEQRYGEAEALHRRALAIDERALGPENGDLAIDLNNLAEILHRQMKFAEEEPVAMRALAIDVKVLGKDHPTVAVDLGNVAALYMAEGRNAAAEPIFRRALEINEKALGPAHPAVALSLSNLATLLRTEGQYGEAETLYRRAISSNLKALGPEHPQVARMMSSLAAMYVEQVKFAAADPLLRQALAIHEKVLGPDAPDVAADLSQLAAMYGAAGRFAEEEPLLRRALAIEEKAYGAKHPDVARRLIDLGAMLRDQGRYADAEPLELRALAILETTLGPHHPDTRECVLNLAVTYFGWNRPDKAAPLFDRHVASLAGEFQSSFAYMSESQRLRFLGTVPGAFPLYFSFVATYRDRDPSLAGKMYDALLWEKGLIANSAAAMRARILNGKDPAAVALYDRLTAKKGELAAASSSGKNLDALEQECNAIEKELVRRSGAVAGEKTLAQATWQDVRKALQPGEAAVEYVRFRAHSGKSWTGANYYAALVVTPAIASPKIVILGDASKVEASALASFRAETAKTRGIALGASQQAPGDGAYAAFWKPVETALGGAKRVYVSADGMLNQMPMGLMRDTDGKLLLERYDLRPVNSTKDLLRPASGPEAKTAVVIGNPLFAMTEAQHRAAVAALKEGGASRAAGLAASGPATRGIGGAALPPLPSTQLEVDAVAEALKSAGWQVAPYTRERALEEVLDGVHRPRVLHVATHGFFLPDAPASAAKQKMGEAVSGIEEPMLRSGLFFAGADRARSGAPRTAGLDDGILTAYQAAQLDLSGTELVVLSACETGLGEQKNGEGVFGLPRGLQEAGAEAVLMSMWSVPDQETQELMTLFYQKWLAGLDKHEALRQAQLQERETVRGRYGKDLPYYWGAFVLIGR
jgi:CHAT domain-containing protein/tetratricopeptide (TPR) repeat protein